MANKYLKHRFTLRETILLWILFGVLMVGLFFGLVFYPIRSRTQDLQTELDAVAEERATTEATKADYDMMKAELKRLETQGDDTVMPASNGVHSRELQDKVDAILVGIDHGYRASITDLQDGVVQRSVRLDFTVNDTNKGAPDITVYKKVRDVLAKLVTTGYRCSMSSLNLNPNGTNLRDANSIAVSTVIEFFELG